MTDPIRLVDDSAVLDPDKVLTLAVGKLNAAVVVGIDKDGKLYVAASHGSPDILMMMTRAQHKIVSLCED